MQVSNIYQLLRQYDKILAVAIFKENELSSSSLVLHKANICSIDAIIVLSYGQKFLSHCTMILSRDHRHMSCDKVLFTAKSVPPYCDVYS